MANNVIKNQRIPNECSFGNGVDLAPYNGTNGNKYYCSTDGYVRCNCANATSHFLVAVGNATGTIWGYRRDTQHSDDGQFYDWAFVRKGSYIWCSKENATSVTFYPIIES